MPQFKKESDNIALASRYAIQIPVRTLLLILLILFPFLGGFEDGECRYIPSNLIMIFHKISSSKCHELQIHERKADIGEGQCSY